jgi:hypothetical protein
VLNLTINSNSFETVTVGIYSVIGNLVTESTVIDLRQSQNTQIDVSHLADGNYLLKVQSDNAIATKQVTVSR